MFPMFQQFINVQTRIGNAQKLKTSINTENINYKSTEFRIVLIILMKTGKQTWSIIKYAFNKKIMLTELNIPWLTSNNFFQRHNACLAT